MGNCNFRLPDSSGDEKNSQGQYKFLDMIGKGGFSKVWKVENRKTKQVIALKMMSKAKILSKKSVHSVINELQLLSQLNHSFIINILAAFQDRRFLYLGMDLLQGGDLRYHICRTRSFTEEQTKFFVMCILIALDYLHSNSVIHRDIKPENLVFDDRGYLHITDLGVARIWKPNNSSDTSGTPGYMAPEVMCRQSHGIAVDYYAVGVIIYELMMGRRPYVGKTRQEIREQILAKQVQVTKSEIPDDWSEEAADIVNKLLIRKPVNRLGAGGPEDVKKHPWFRGQDWKQIANKGKFAPFIPPKDQNYSSKIALESQTDLNDQNELMLRRDSIQELFKGYNYKSIQNTSIMTRQRTSSVLPDKSLGSLL